jgi:WD40 repeat protein
MQIQVTGRGDNDLGWTGLTPCKCCQFQCAAASHIDSCRRLRYDAPSLASHFSRFLYVCCNCLPLLQMATLDLQRLQPTGRLVTGTAHQTVVTCAAFCPAEQASQVAVGGTDCVLRLWDVATRARVLREESLRLEDILGRRGAPVNPPMAMALAQPPPEDCRPPYAGRVYAPALVSLHALAG